MKKNIKWLSAMLLIGGIVFLVDCSHKKGETFHMNFLPVYTLPPYETSAPPKVLFNRYSKEYVLMTGWEHLRPNDSFPIFYGRSEFHSAWGRVTLDTGTLAWVDEAYRFHDSQSLKRSYYKWNRRIHYRDSFAVVMLIKRDSIRKLRNNFQ